MCAFLCVAEHIPVCVFGHVSRINNSEPSSLSDLCALKVMMGNLSCRRKSILRKTHNFLAKGRIIFSWSSVSFEKGVVKIEDRREGEKVLKNRETECKKKICTSVGHRLYGPRTYCILFGENIQSGYIYQEHLIVLRVPVVYLGSLRKGVV